MTLRKAVPFVKWAGGKRALAKELASLMPNAFGTYWEPFVGGGALFFEASGRIAQAVLSDTNAELITCYNAVKRNPDPLIAALKAHASQHSKTYYYAVRSRHTLQNSTEIAARLIYLNRTCFNGLYRVNRKGEFNVPMGGYSNPKITMWTGDNPDIMRGMNSECVDLIYLDPLFNSNRNYAAPIGSEAAAFKDTWELDDVDLAWGNFGAVAGAVCDQRRGWRTGRAYRAN